MLFGLVALHAALVLLPRALLGPAAILPGDAVLAALLALLSLFLLAELSGDARRPSPQPFSSPADRRHTRLAALTGVLTLAVLWTAVGEQACRSLAAPQSSVWRQPVGAWLMFAGIALRYAAIRSLGRYFGNRITVLPDQRLVRRGIYRWLRHPSEAGLLAITLGACLLLGGGVAATIWCACLLPAVLRRIAGEDRQLAAAFAEDFAAYRRDVPALMPFVY